MSQNSIYTALRRQAAQVDRSALARIVLGGADRRGLLHGLLTNDIEALGPGTGCYAAWLTPQGRMIADLILLELGDRMFLLVPAARREAVVAQIEASIFTEEVTIEDEAGLFEHFGVDGPRSAEVIARVLSASPSGGSDLAPAGHSLLPLPLYRSAETTLEGGSVVIARTDWLGIPGYDLFVETAAAEAWRQRLAAAGAPPADRAAAETVRVESGRPLFGADMDDHTIPLEAGIEDRAISFTKGCYVGQEVIVRILHRGGGRVARRLVGLTLDRLAPSGTPLVTNGRESGRLTSVVQSPALGRPIALGYVGRESAEPGTRLELGTGGSAVVTKLPFVELEVTEVMEGPESDQHEGTE